MEILSDGRRAQLPTPEHLGTYISGVQHAQALMAQGIYPTAVLEAARELLEKGLVKKDGTAQCVALGAIDAAKEKLHPKQDFGLLQIPF